MKTPISYYGGKQNMVRHILPLFPQHKQYVEPFFGGGAVFFAKTPSDHEVINDLDNRVINFYRVLQGNFEGLQDLIKSTLHSEAVHKYAKDILEDEAISEVERAWAFWVRCNMSFGYVVGAGFAFANSKNRIGLKNKRDKFESHYKKRVEGIEIFCRDAIDLIKLKDTPDTFFYCDPPYVSSDCGHYKGYTKDNFMELLELLSNIKGKFLLSSYPDPELEKYSQWHTKKIIQNLSVTQNTYSDTKTEVLTYNYLEMQNKLF